MRTAFLAVLAILACGAAGGTEKVRLREDPPVATRPGSGGLEGTLKPAAKIARVYAFSRATGKRYEPSRFDRKTGRFAFEGLPGDASYDVGCVTTDGARIEGIDLSWHEARMQRLAEIRRKQLEVPSPPPHKFSAADAEELLRYVKELKDFTDLRRVLYLRGEGRRAVLLVEAMRVRDFYAKRGDQLIWRTELWYFKYQYGGWERVANVERVLERHRISAARWKSITLVYDPGLSVYVDENGRSRPVQFRIPQKLDPARGRIAGTEPAQQTKPILSWPGKPPEEPAPPSTSGNGQD